MATHRLVIKEVNRTHPISIVKPADFTCEPVGEIDPSEVLLDPKFSLYCFDRESNSAIFVESDDPEAVDRAPFYYQGQVQHAIGLISMPFDVFHRVAQQIPDPGKGLIFVHSVGRCGSTLVSKVLQSVPSVHSLSEPDDLTQLVNLWNSDPGPDEWLPELLKSSVRWRCKPRIGPPALQVAIKSRSEVMLLADYFGVCFPNAKHLFLYRDAVSWMRSLYRGWASERDVYDRDQNQRMEESWSRTLPMVREYRREDEPMNAIQIRILAWISCMEGYLRLVDQGIPTGAVRFEDLTSDPSPILRGLFEFCEIDDVDWTAIEAVLGRDSQAGTIYDREERKRNSRELPDGMVHDVLNMVASRPLLRTPDLVVPGSLPGT